MLKEDGLPDEWYCHVCEANNRAPPPLASTPMAPLLDALSRQPPTAFRLSASIQNHFEGVKASPLGEYEEVVSAPVKPASTRSVVASCLFLICFFSQDTR
jgi:hypothetical protein